MDYYHNYFLEQHDSGTEKKFIKKGLSGYGGNYNFYFFDLYSMPWIQLVWDDADPLDSWTWFYTPIGNLHDCPTSSCFSKIVQEDVNSTIYHIVTPSFVTTGISSSL